MACAVRSGFVLFALVFAAGCDTDVPLQVGTQNATVEIIPNAAQIDRFKVWDLTEDSDGQPGPDDVDGDGIAGDTSLWCEFDTTVSAETVPWTYSVRISVVRAGENQPTALTSPEAATGPTTTGSPGEAFNRGSYDSDAPPHSTPNPASFPLTHVRGACSGNAAIRCNPNSTSGVCDGAGTCEAQSGCSADHATLCDPDNQGGTCRSRGAGVCVPDPILTFCSRDPSITGCEPTCDDLGLGSCVEVPETRVFRFSTSNRRRLTAANRELLRAGPNFIFDACIGDPICTAQVDLVVGAATPALGRCPGEDTLGEPGLDPGNPIDLNSDDVIFGLQLNKGDRVIVEARLSDTEPGVITFLGNPGIRARLSIDGIVLQADEVQCAQGTDCRLSSDLGDDSPNVSFSFTTK